MNMMKRIWCFISLCAVFFLAGCGGGTSGSGVKSYEGTVTTKEGLEMSGVSVTIESTGDSSTTDASGKFAIQSDAYGPEVPLLFESPVFQNRFVLRNVPVDSARITMDVTVDTKTDTIEVNNIGLRAKFAGLCDYYFENREIIRQANQVPRGTRCSLNVEVLGDGERLSDIPVVLEVAACDPGSLWSQVKEVKTGNGPHAGSAEINFEFQDSNDFCRYRVRVDNGDRNARSPSYPIDTFSEQAYSRKKM